VSPVSMNIQPRRPKRIEKRATVETLRSPMG
jgi:hypothetical protein